MYESCIYFASPTARWDGTVRDEDVLARFQSRWKCIALWSAQSLHARLDATRCGYVVTHLGAIVESIGPLENPA